MKHTKKIFVLVLAISLFLSAIPFSSVTANAVVTPYVCERDAGKWLFPLDERYYQTCSDWAGCLGKSVYYACPICGSSSCWKDYGTDGRTDGALGHNGIDIAATSATVKASASGTVVGVFEDSSRGKTVLIEHKIVGTEYSYYSYYQHLSSIGTSVGKSVSAGDALGITGNTGTSMGEHLHFGIVRAKSGTIHNSNELYAVESIKWLLKDSDGEIGRICNNPAKNLPQSGGCLNSFQAHLGSVTYVFNKNEVSIGNGKESIVADSFPCYGTIVTNSKTYLKTLPCSEDSNSASKNVDVIPKGITLTVGGIYLNKWGNYWYKVLINNADPANPKHYSKEAYFYSGDGNPSTFTPMNEIGIITQDPPSSLTQGQSFGLNGYVNNQYAVISLIGAKVTTLSGDYITGDSVSVAMYSVPLKSTVDNNTVFNKLGTGTYRFEIYEKQYGYKVNASKKLEKYSTQVFSVMDVTFVVKSPSQITYSVCFDNSGKGDKLDYLNYTVVSGSSIYLPTLYDLPGYTFAGWTDVQGSSTVKYNGGASYTVSANKTLYAVWLKIYQLKIFFKSGTASSDVTEHTAFDYKLSNSDYLKYSGYYFSGWATDPEATVFEYRPGDTIRVDGIVSLYPIYVSHAEAISGNPVLIFNIKDFTDANGNSYTIASADVTIYVPSNTTHYGEWSDWTTSEIVPASTIEVEKAPLYRYAYFLCNRCGDHNPSGGKCGCGGTSNDFYQIWSPIPYSQSKSQVVSYDNTARYTMIFGDKEYYFANSNLNSTTIGTIDGRSSSPVILQGFRSREILSDPPTEVKLSGYKISSHTHSYVPKVTAPTCTDRGYTTYTCQCGASYNDNFVEATGHQHTELRNAKAATCSATGYTGDTYCMDCGTKLSSGTTIAKKAHTVVTDKAVAATCTTAGKTAGSHCSVCGTVITAQTVIPATGHQHTEVRNAKAATETAEGYTGDTCCKDCGAILSRGSAIPKLTPSSSVVITVPHVKAVKGAEVTMDLTISKNSGISVLVLTLKANSALTFLGATNGNVFTTLDCDTNLLFLGGDSSDTDEKLVTLCFRVSATAADGDYSVALIFREAYDIDDNPVNISVTSGKVTVSSILYGDANGDGKVDSKDLNLLRKYMAAYDYATGTGPVAVEAGADANGDGKVDAKDLSMLRRYIAAYDYDTGTSTVVLGPNH